MVIMIDNYDSFTYILAQYIEAIGHEITIKRNNEISIADMRYLKPDCIVISPGPGTPKNAGITLSVIEEFQKCVPILGVCLGHQAIGQIFGASVVKATAPVHGKTSLIHHNECGMFAGLPSPFKATRYHSLIINELPNTSPLEVTARTIAGDIMAIRHKFYPIEGVQFHPESVLTDYGQEMIANFFSLHVGSHVLR